MVPAFRYAWNERNEQTNRQSPAKNSVVRDAIKTAVARFSSPISILLGQRFRQFNREVYAAFSIPQSGASTFRFEDREGHWTASKPIR
jgi:hypothetical protein